MESLTAILLAAGGSRRFGANKMVHRLPGGESIGLVSARNLISAVPRGIAVVRPGEEAFTHALVEMGYWVLVNRHSDRGVGESLSLAVTASVDTAGWVVGLGDMPWIEPSTIAAVAACLGQGASIAAPSYQGRRGHPVGFSSRWRDRLIELNGEDQGGRQLLLDYPDELSLLPTDDAGVLRDVDFPWQLVDGGEAAVSELESP